MIFLRMVDSKKPVYGNHANEEGRGPSLHAVRASSELITEDGLEKLGGLLRAGVVLGLSGERGKAGHQNFEQWLELNTFLNQYFFEQEGGRLGQLLLDLNRMANTELAQEQNAIVARQIIKYTSHIAHQLAPLIDRINAVSSGTRDQTVDMICGPDECPTAIGLLVKLARRIGEHGETEAIEWDLKKPREGIAPILMVSDPFDPRYKGQWMEKMPVEDRRPIFKLSETRTGSLLYQLKTTIELLKVSGRQDREGLVMCYEIIADWLEEQLVYYRDGNETELGQYHFGLEPPNDLMGILGALDGIKHHSPTLFAQMLGVNPYCGDNASPYWGSFLHKAIANTQAVVGEEGGRNLMVKVMMKELLTMDKSVTLYTGKVTEANLRTLTNEVARNVRDAATTSEKTQLLILSTPMLMQMSFEAQVHKELTDLQRNNYKQETARAEHALEDHEHPLMAMKVISETPMAVLQGPLREPLQAIFSMRLSRRTDFERLKEDCKMQAPHVVKALFDAMPAYVVQSDGRLDHGPLVRAAALCAASYDVVQIFQSQRYKTGTDFLGTALKGRHIQRGIFRPASVGDPLINYINVNRYSAKLAMWENPTAEPELFQDQVAALVAAGKPCPETYSSEERVEYVSIYLAYKQKDLKDIPAFFGDAFLEGMSDKDRSATVKRIVGHVKAVESVGAAQSFWDKKIYAHLEKYECVDDLKWSAPRIATEEASKNGFDEFLRAFSPAGARIFLVEIQSCESEKIKRRVLRVFASDETLRPAVRECGAVYVDLYPPAKEVLQEPNGSQVKKLTNEDRFVFLLLHANERDFIQGLLMDRLGAVNSNRWGAHFDERPTHGYHFDSKKEREEKKSFNQQREEAVEKYDAEITKEIGFNPHLILEAVPEESRLELFEAIGQESPALAEKLFNCLDSLDFDQICLYMFTPGRPAQIYERLPEIWTRPSLRPRFNDFSYSNQLAEQLGFGFNGYPMRVAMDKRNRKKLGLTLEEVLFVDGRSVYHFRTKLKEILESQEGWWEMFRKQFRSIPEHGRGPQSVHDHDMYLGQIFELWDYLGNMPQLIVGKELELAELFLDVFELPQDNQKKYAFSYREYFQVPVVKTAVSAAYVNLSPERKAKVLSLCSEDGYEGGVLKSLTGSHEVVMDVMATKPELFTPLYITIRADPDAKRDYLAYLGQNPESALHLFDAANPEKYFYNKPEKEVLSEELPDILSAVPTSHRGEILKAACARIGNEFGALDKAEAELVNLCPVDQQDELRAYIVEKRSEYVQGVAAREAELAQERATQEET